VESPENASLVAEKIIASLLEPFDLNGQSGRVGASIGIALYPDDALDAKELVSCADAAMYRAKHAGKNTWTFFGNS